jgi:dTDP-4-amino-4,6-dideoxygalactose transaminase
MMEMQAVIGRLQLKQMPEWTQNVMPIWRASKQVLKIVPILL